MKNFLLLILGLIVGCCVGRFWAFTSIRLSSPDTAYLVHPYSNRGTIKTITGLPMVEAAAIEGLSRDKEELLIVVVSSPMGAITTFRPVQVKE